jgi:subtilisin family serine protease
VKNKFVSLEVIARSAVGMAGFRRNAVAACAVAVMTLAIAPSTAQTAVGTDAQGEFARGRVLVVARAGVPSAEVEKVAGAHGGKARRIGQTGVYIFDLPGNASEVAVQQQLARNPRLKSAELDRGVRPTYFSNDPYAGSAWHLTKIEANTGWDTSEGSGVVIAILDTGVEGSHPDLAANMVAGWNFHDNNSNTADTKGHGTWVAGAAAAATNNGTGVASVAGRAKIMPLRIAAPDGLAYWSTIAQGVTYAADKGARVASISYDGLVQSSAVQSAAQYMKGKGGLVVVAAGNSGSRQNFTPTATMISVSATDANDQITSFSSYGSYVTLSAPGSSIWTTSTGGGYTQGIGTSFSTPIVAATAALVMAAKPSLSSTQVESLLFSSATDLGANGRDDYYGYGRVNAAAAVAAAVGAPTTPPPDTTAPIVAIAAPLAGSSVSGWVPVNVSASDNVGVTRVELRVNGAAYATDSSSPYAFSWDSTLAANGSVNLQAVAYDAAGNAGASAVTTITVANTTAPPAPPPTTDTTPPLVAFLSPSNGSAVGGTVAIRTGASDNAGAAGIKQSLYVDGVLKATSTGESLSYKWNTRKVSAGGHTLQVIARDQAGNATTVSMQVSK